MKPGDARILIATESNADAQLIRRLLDEDFDNISTCTEPERSVTDFERTRPHVLVLAFDGLERAESYYLGLYRLSKQVNSIPHRTLILCNKNDLRRVYELCKKEYFDDYILFWPMTHDATRLSMSVHLALRQFDQAHGQGAIASDFAVQARRIAELESRLRQYSAQGETRVAAATSSLNQVGQQIGAALDGFSRRIAEDGLQGTVEVRDPAALQAEFDRLRAEHVEPPLKQAEQAVGPVRDWVGALTGQLGPELETARALGNLANRVRPLVLAVDDDPVQHALLKQVLSGLPIDLQFASSASEALGLLRRRRPGVVLMDVGLPDLDGVEAVRRIKSAEAFADVPVMMITSHSDRDLVVSSRAAGASDFVVKPFHRATVVAKVSRLLGLGSELPP